MYKYLIYQLVLIQLTERIKIKDYLKALNSDKDYAKIEFKRVKSKIEEDGMVLYVQQQKKMSRVIMR